MTRPTAQPMSLRRGGAKRGSHGTILTPVSADPTPSESIGTDTPRTERPATRAASSSTLRQTAAAPVGDAAARAKAAYDAKPKVIFRGVDKEIADKLQAIYKHQLHQPGGVEGWSEWGRILLRDLVAQYEKKHGAVEVTDVKLRSGRPKA